jgi:hypothetical protein
MMIAVLVAAILPGFMLVQQTTRADYYVPTDTPQLRVDSAACEVFLHRVEQLLAVRVPRFSYYRVRSAHDVFQRTGISAYGVAYPGPLYVVSAAECSYHEIVHVAIFQGRRPISFWEEGMAGFLSGECASAKLQGVIRGEAHRRRISWNEAVTGFAFAGTTQERWPWYETSCAFTSYLARQHGSEVLARFITGRGEFQALFGMSSEEAWNQWCAGTPRTSPSRK